MVRGTVAARSGDMQADDDELVLGDIFQILLQPCHLFVRDIGGIRGRAGVEHVVEHDKMTVADVVGVIRGAERRLEAGIGIGIDGYGLIVVVVADDLENGHADLSDTLLVNLVEGHVVPDQVTQRNAVNGGLQFLLHVGDQQGQHLLVEHRHLVVAADLHVGQRQQGETLFFARAFEFEATLHDVVVAHGDLLVDLRHAVLHRDFVFGGDGDEYERGVPLHAHLVDALGVGGRHRDAVAHDHALDRAGTVGDTAHEVHAGLGGDVHLLVEAAENLGAFVLAAGHEAGGQQEDQQIFDVFYHFFGFLKFISCPGAPDSREPPGSPGINNRGSARSGCWPKSPSWESGTGFCSCR